MPGWGFSVWGVVVGRTDDLDQRRDDVLAQLCVCLRVSFEHVAGCFAGVFALYGCVLFGCTNVRPNLYRSIECSLCQDVTLTY